MLLVLFPSLELESLPSVFARSDSTSVSSSRFTDMGIPAKGWERGGAIILTVSVEWERLFEGADYSRDGYYSRKMQ